MAATLLGLSGIDSRAQTEEEVSALVAEALRTPDWETAFTATTGAGYKDNVFLSHANPRGAAFASAGAELLVLRSSLLGPRLSVFANADAHHYFGNGVSHQEYTSFNHAQIEHDFNDFLTGSLAGEYYYQDQLLDVTVLELAPTRTNVQASTVRAVPVLGHTFSLLPGLRVGLPGHNWFGLEASAVRQLLDKPLDDDWEAGLKVSLGHKYGWDSKLMLDYEPSWWFYDTNPALTSTGDFIPDSLRERFQQNVRLKWQHNWDEAKRWHTDASYGVRLNTENGGGYNDYAKWFATGRIQYRAHGWEISAEGRFARYDYAHQTVSVTNPALRTRTEWSAVLEVERRLTEKVALLAAYEHETNGSNDPLETYSVNTISASLRWEF